MHKIETESQLILTFLGTGTSHGVPTVDCMMSDYATCPRGICKEAVPGSRHRRTRSSIVLSYGGKTVLIDTSADFREQVLREGIKKLDAVLLTHRHADHIMGMPDIRSYSRTVPGGLPVFGSAETIEAIGKSFSYIFNPDTFIGGGIPELEAIAVDDVFSAGGIEFTPIRVEHGDCGGCYGYRFFDIAYIPDVKHIPTESMALLRGVKTLIIDMLRFEPPHSTHMIVSEVEEVARELGVERVYGTHFCHDIHYEEDEQRVNSTMFFAYDGLRLEL